MFMELDQGSGQRKETGLRAVASRLSTTRDNTETIQGGRRPRNRATLESMSVFPKMGI